MRLAVNREMSRVRRILSPVRALPCPGGRGRRRWGAAIVLSLALLLPEGALPLALRQAGAEAAPTAKSGAATASTSKTTTAKKTATSARKSTKTSSSKSSSPKVSKSKSTSKSTTKASSRKKRTRRSRSYARYGSRAALVMDARTGEVLFEKNSATQQPVASLTKLMTNIVFLETEPDLDRKVTVAREDLRGSGHTQLRRGEILTVRQLLYHSLMSSDNAATKTLVRASGIPEKEFLDRMNRKAAILGLTSTRFVEFTGLDAGNVSSAADLAQLLKYASRQTLIAEITSQPEYSYRSNRRSHHLVNSNRLARYGQIEVLSGKTGFIRSAGYCLATWVREGSRDLIAVVLGAPTNPARFNETRRILEQASLADAGGGAGGSK